MTPKERPITCVLIFIALGLLAPPLFAQTCSQLGQYYYCGSEREAVIVAPLGDQSGVILGPGTNLTPYQRFGEPPSEQIYIQPPPSYDPPSSYKYEPRRWESESPYGPSLYDMGVLE